MTTGILNFSTKISVFKTAAEIQKQLVKAGARGIYQEYDADQVLCGLSFQLKTDHGIINFKLPANIDGVYKHIQYEKRLAKRLRTREQAARIAWRIIKDWVEAQVAIIKAEIVKAEEVFFPYALDNQGQTIFKAFEAQGLKMIAHEEDVVQCKNG